MTECSITKMGYEPLSGTHFWPLYGTMSHPASTTKLGPNGSVYVHSFSKLTGLVAAYLTVC